MSSLYAELLGPGWQRLAPSVRGIHGGGGAFRGVFAVRRGTGVLARALGVLLGMPPAGASTPVTLAVVREGACELWRRTFGAVALATRQWARAGMLVERLGLVQCWFRLRVEDGALVFDQARATLGFGRLALPLPRALAPRVTGRATPEGPDRVRVDVRIHAPLAGLLVAYEGLVSAAATAPPPDRSAPT